MQCTHKSLSYTYIYDTEYKLNKLYKISTENNISAIREITIIVISKILFKFVH